jgi:hypothetical protein
VCVVLFAVVGCVPGGGFFLFAFIAFRPPRIVGATKQPRKRVELTFYVFYVF